MTGKQKFDANEKKAELRMLAECHCVVCGEYLPPDLFDLAHRVAKTKAVLNAYGPEVVHHPLNIVPTCHGTKAGRSCNDRVNIGKSPMAVRELTNRIIRINTGRDKAPDMAEYYAELAREFQEGL